MGEYGTETLLKSKAEFWKHEGDHHLDTYSTKSLPEHIVKSSSGSLQKTPNSAGSKGTSLPPPPLCEGDIASSNTRLECFVLAEVITAVSAQMPHGRRPFGALHSLHTLDWTQRTILLLVCLTEDWTIEMLWFFHSSRQQSDHITPQKYQPYNLEWLKQAFSLYSYFPSQKHLRKIHCKLQEPEVWIYGYTVPALNQTHCNNFFEDMSGIDKAVQTA